MATSSYLIIHVDKVLPSFGSEQQQNDLRPVVQSSQMHDCLVIPETQEYMNNDKRTVFPVNPCETCTALVEEADNVSVTLTLKDMM